MHPESLSPILSTYSVDSDRLLSLLQQGIEIEKLRLEMQHVTNAESIESRLNIIHGERFVSLLLVLG